MLSMESYMYYIMHAHIATCRNFRTASEIESVLDLTVHDKVKGTVCMRDYGSNNSTQVSLCQQSHNCFTHNIRSWKQYSIVYFE